MIHPKALVLDTQYMQHLITNRHREHTLNHILYLDNMYEHIKSSVCFQ